VFEDAGERERKLVVDKENSRGLEDSVIGLVGGVVKGGEDILALKKWIILKNFVERGSGSEQFENIGDTNAQATNTGAAAAFAGVNANSLKVFAFHRLLRLKIRCIPGRARVSGFGVLAP